MLCSVCLSMFKSRARTGKHHETAASLESAAKERCYICTALLDRMKEGSGFVFVGDEKQNRPLEYVFHAMGKNDRSGTLGFRAFDSNEHQFSLQPLYQSSTTLRKSSVGSCRRSLRLKRMAIASKVAKRKAEKESPAYQQLQQEKMQRLSNELLQSEVSLPGPCKTYAKGLPREIPSYTGHASVAERVRTWFIQCTKKHKQCGRKRDLNWFPARLLDLSGTNPHLILCHLKKPEGAYATLSHCWGPNPTFLTLTTSNFQEMCNEIPINTLPKTFREAIEVAKWLQIRYLWIDSLCIIQSGEGSREDWQKHVKAMRSVYENSILTIAAGQAQSANGGCFVSRNTSLVQPCLIDWHAHGYSGRRLERQSYAIMDEFLVHTGLQSLPLASRAWVVQERLLSPRVLNFGSKQVFWECAELIACEAFPMGIEESKLASDRHIFNLPALLKPKVPDKSISYQESWRQILRYYTGCALTHPAEDKFAAIAGIAERIAPFFKSDYVAGFFRTQLPSALLWMRSHQGEAPKRVLEPYRAPTWSWASMDVQLAFPSFKEFDLFASVVNIKIELVDPENSFGQVRSAELILRGFVVGITWELDISLEDSLYWLGTNDLKLSPRCCWFDETDTVTSDLDQAVVLCILSGKYNVSCLILKHVGAESGSTYTRVGTCSLEPENEVSELVQWFQESGEKDVILI